MAVVEVGDTLLSLVISIVQTVKRFVRQLSVTREKKEIKLPKGNSTYDVGHSWTQREGGATYVYLVTICYEDADLYLSRCRSVWTPRWFGGLESRIPEPSADFRFRFRSTGFQFWFWSESQSQSPKKPAIIT